MKTRIYLLAALAALGHIPPAEMPTTAIRHCLIAERRYGSNPLAMLDSVAAGRRAVTGALKPEPAAPRTAAQLLAEALQIRLPKAA